MTKYREILRLHAQGISQRGIAASCGCSRNTVAKVLARAQDVGMAWPLPDNLNEKDITTRLFPEQNAPTSRKMPDYEYVHRELAKNGVTLSLLWNEYCEICREGGEIPFMYTQFCKYYREYASRTKATMHIDRKPGEQMEVDWAGQTAFLIDTDTSDPIPIYIFVAVLSCSGYAYVEGFLSQNQESWITAHVNAYRFFGGATRILVPDNLKTGVDKSSWYDPVINRVYHEMAEHYGTVIIPARVRKPKDKPNAEGTVGIVSTWILAALRNQQFLSLPELNGAILEKLDEFNRKPFQKKPGSRLSVFLEEEKHFLQPLPRQPYELAQWKVATVQYNYHISVDKMFYSVPYEYIKQKVEVRLTRNVIEVIFDGNRICSHPRLYGQPGQYSTVADHMPPDHQKYAEWNAERFLKWAGKVGPNTEIVVKAILTSHKIEQQGYRACMGLLRLGDKYSVIRLEAACKRALSYTPRPSFRNVQTILKTGQDRAVEEKPIEGKEDIGSFGFTRGAAYYGRNSK